MEEYVLYKKYRPKEFNEVLGNESICNTLQKMIKTNKLPQVILFTGNSGTGKTTIARILATKLTKAENDITEMNLSDKNCRGIDGAIELIKNSSYRSLSGGNRVYILDEVDQTTVDWQKNMKKILEDTPKNLYFFLCTTLPNKLIKDIHTRATTFELEDPNEVNLQKYLQEIAKKEEATISRGAIRKIIQNSGNSVRKAMVNLNTVLETDESQRESVISKLDVGNNSEVIELCRIMLKNPSWKEVCVILKELKENPESIRQAILGYMSAVALNNPYSASVACDIIVGLQDPCYVKAFLVAQLYALCI